MTRCGDADRVGLPPAASRIAKVSRPGDLSLTCLAQSTRSDMGTLFRGVRKKNNQMWAMRQRKGLVVDGRVQLPHGHHCLL